MLTQRGLYRRHHRTDSPAVLESKRNPAFSSSFLSFRLPAFISSTQVAMEEGPLGVEFPAFEDDYRNMRKRCSMACEAFNTLPEDATMDERAERWNEIVKPRGHLSANGGAVTPQPHAKFPAGGAAPYVKTPFWCDYGTNLHIGRTTFINRYCVILDTPVQPVTIGEECLFGPEVHIYAVSHDEVREQVSSPSYGKKVTIGNRCWIGGRTIILGGVTIGDGCVIGAGSVVTKSIPAGHVAYGNPARVYRKVSKAGERTVSPPLMSGIPVNANNGSSPDFWFAIIAAVALLFVDAIRPGSDLALHHTHDPSDHAIPLIWITDRLRLVVMFLTYLGTILLFFRIYKACC